MIAINEVNQLEDDFNYNPEQDVEPIVTPKEKDKLEMICKKYEASIYMVMNYFLISWFPIMLYDIVRDSHRP